MIGFFPGRDLFLLPSTPCSGRASSNWVDGAHAKLPIAWGSSLAITMIVTMLCERSCAPAKLKSTAGLRVSPGSQRGEREMCYEMK